VYEGESSVARQENALGQLRDLAGLTFVEDNQKNYELVAGTSKQLSAVRAKGLIGRRLQADGKALEDLLASQDRITAELAK